MPRSEITHLSVYSELLKMAVAQSDSDEGSVGDLVSRVLSVRPPETAATPSAERVAEWLTYDVLLVRLCELLEVPHRMLDPDAGPSTRAQAEELVARKVPFFHKALNTA